ncbi:hypothetical protein [Bacillus smithii]|uniref:hypothetical protein n=1 Tax=Bacillus smithii TaxID=1479 RepID=UPI003D1E4067
MPTSIQGRTVAAGIAANLITKAIPSNADVLLVVFHITKSFQERLSLSPRSPQLYILQ